MSQNFEKLGLIFNLLRIFNSIQDCAEVPLPLFLIYFLLFNHTLILKMFLIFSVPITSLLE